VHHARALARGTDRNGLHVGFGVELCIDSRHEQPRPGLVALGRQIGAMEGQILAPWRKDSPSDSKLGPQMHQPTKKVVLNAGPAADVNMMGSVSVGRQSLVEGKDCGEVVGLAN
jgi:hypothetical protein